VSERVLEVEALEVAYRGAGLGVQGIDLHADRGEIVAMLGANGAGKTTTLRAITGFLPGEIAKVTAGRITFEGRALGAQPPHWRVHQGMSIVPERDKVFRTLTVEENLRVSASTHRGHDPAATMATLYEVFPALNERRTTSAGLLSGGERQMLAIGRALMTGPSMLLADEVSLGIAPGLVIELLDTLRRVSADRGITVLLVEQNAAAALRVADRVYVLEHGRCVMSGTPRELLNRPDFFDAYFGLGESEEGAS
jgi:branched-chain amino acid transport system ATP-binding protein